MAQFWCKKPVPRTVVVSPFRTAECPTPHICQALNLGDQILQGTCGTGQHLWKLRKSRGFPCRFFQICWSISKYYALYIYIYATVKLIHPKSSKSIEPHRDFIHICQVCIRILLQLLLSMPFTTAVSKSQWRDERAICGWRRAAPLEKVWLPSQAFGIGKDFVGLDRNLHIGSGAAILLLPAGFAVCTSWPWAGPCWTTSSLPTALCRPSLSFVLGLVLA